MKITPIDETTFSSEETKEVTTVYSVYETQAGIDGCVLAQTILKEKYEADVKANDELLAYYTQLKKDAEEAGVKFP